MACIVFGGCSCNAPTPPPGGEPGYVYYGFYYAAASSGFFGTLTFWNVTADLDARTWTITNNTSRRLSLTLFYAMDQLGIVPELYPFVLPYLNPGESFTLPLPFQSEVPGKYLYYRHSFYA